MQHKPQQELQGISTVERHLLREGSCQQLSVSSPSCQEEERKERKEGRRTERRKGRRGRKSGSPIAKLEPSTLKGALWHFGNPSFLLLGSAISLTAWPFSSSLALPAGSRALHITLSCMPFDGLPLPGRTNGDWEAVLGAALHCHGEQSMHVPPGNPLKRKAQGELKRVTLRGMKPRIHPICHPPTDTLQQVLKKQPPRTNK